MPYRIALIVYIDLQNSGVMSTEKSAKEYVRHSLEKTAFQCNPVVNLAPSTLQPETKPSISKINAYKLYMNFRDKYGENFVCRNSA